MTAVVYSSSERFLLLYAWLLRCSYALAKSVGGRGGCEEDEGVASKLEVVEIGLRAIISAGCRDASANELAACVQRLVRLSAVQCTKGVGTLRLAIVDREHSP